MSDSSVELRTSELDTFLTTEGGKRCARVPRSLFVLTYASVIATIMERNYLTAVSVGTKPTAEPFSFFSRGVRPPLSVTVVDAKVKVARLGERWMLLREHPHAQCTRHSDCFFGG